MHSFKDAKLERLPTVLQRVGLSRSAVYAKVAAREFPAPVHLGARASAWVSHEVDEWIAQRAARRDAPASAGA